MPTKGTKQQLKVQSIIEGKTILTNLSSFLDEVLTIVSSGEKRDLMKLPLKIKLMTKGVRKVVELLDQALKYDGNFRLANDLLSATVAEEKKQKVINEMLQTSVKLVNKRKSMVEQVLEKSIKNSNTPSIVSPPAKRQRRRSSTKEADSIVTQLENYEKPNVEGSRYCLRQLVVLTQIDTKSPVFNYSVKPPLMQMLSEGKKCVVNYHTLQRWIRRYNEKKILPLKGDEGIKPGRPALVSIGNLPSLTNRVLQNSGKVDTVQDLSNDIVDLHQHEMEERGSKTIGNSTPICRHALKKYTSQLSFLPGISLIKPSGARSQGARRQMAGTSMRNVMSQAATLLVSSFIKGSYDKPKGLPKGSSLAHRVMQQVTGHAMKPIHTFQHLNYDISALEL